MSRSISWHWLASALVLSAGILASDIAAAAPGSRLCRQIEAQLASPGGNSGKAGRYSAAIQRQRGEIGKVRGQLRAAGCGFFSSSSSTCRALSRSAQRMERNLNSLQVTHSRLRGSGSGKSRAQLLAALDANNCRGRKSIVVASRQPGLLEQLFGGPDNNSSFVYDRDDGASEPRDHESGQAWQLGSGLDPAKYRTFCVRTCDGYYFPMSPASRGGELGRDAQNCQTACQGADMQLYYHRGAGEEAEAMMSVASGTAYGDLPTAFAYRSDRPADAACSCAIKARGFTIIAGDGKKPELPAKLAPLQTDQPDPDTLANIDGDLGPAAIQKSLSKSNNPALAELPVLAKRKVRVVGPVFLPDPTAATGQRVPGQTEVQ